MPWILIPVSIYSVSQAQNKQLFHCWAMSWTCKTFHFSLKAESKSTFRSSPIAISMYREWRLWLLTNNRIHRTAVLQFKLRLTQDLCGGKKKKHIVRIILLKNHFREEKIKMQGHIVIIQQGAAVYLQSNMLNSITESWGEIRGEKPGAGRIATMTWRASEKRVLELINVKLLFLCPLLQKFWGGGLQMQ